MSEYIKREDVEYTMRKAFEAVQELIPDIPSADVVEVVRCKECKHNAGGTCEYTEISVKDDDYCSYGERERSRKMSEYIKQGFDVSANFMHDEQPDFLRVHGKEYVQVVRCKDCKYRKKLPNVSYGECIYSASMVSDNDYCSNGERKQDK